MPSAEFNQLFSASHSKKRFFSKSPSIKMYQKRYIDLGSQFRSPDRAARVCTLENHRTQSLKKSSYEAEVCCNSQFVKSLCADKFSVRNENFMP